MDTLPLDWILEFTNAQTLRNIPNLDQMPTSAIIGYVTVTGFEEGVTDSLWDAGEQCIKWKLDEAYLFDEPILNVKGKLGLFDYPLDEDNLPPAHKAVINFPVIENGKCKLKVDQYTIDFMKKETWFAMDITKSNESVFFDEKDNLYPISELVLEGPSETLSLKVKQSGVAASLDEDQKPISYINVFGEEVDWEYIAIEIER